MTQEQLQDKIRGSLMGGAIGDALGYSVEFIYSFEEIKAKYGKEGIVEYDLSDEWVDEKSGKALFSDDTQMSLYTAEALLEAEKTHDPLIPTICDAYLAWYGGQTGRKVKIAYESALAKIKELNQNRAPGNTCLSALLSIHSGKKPMNVSKGCGGVMRVAPIGLYGASHGWGLEKTARLAGEAAELTHLHPLSTYSSAGLAVLCQLCASADEVDKLKFKEYVEQMLDIVGKEYGADSLAMNEFRDIIRRTVDLAETDTPDWEVIEKEIGGGWVAEETLAIAIFSVLRHIEDFRVCMICAVNHGGDSDSTGAVAGNILGALHGYASIPDSFKTHIQLSALLLSLADRL